jgi:hypothetical protein
MLKITYPARTSSKACVATSAHQFGRQTKAPAGKIQTARAPRTLELL